jgi:DNA-binding response OmpR family regulator
MPEMDGFSFLNQAKRTKLEAPVLVLTSYDSRDVFVKALILGAKEVITKPTDCETLLQKVNSVI